MTEVPTLEGLAHEFANKLTTLTREVLGEDTPRFHAVEMADGKKVRVQPIQDDEIVRQIPLSISNEPRLGLLVSYYCCWDGSSTFLATDKSEVHVFYAGVPDPLFRFEYERKGDDPPGAHTHVHAHRDEVAYLLRLAESGRPAQKFRHDRLPRLSELHLPVGGHRMRPALEDVFLFLKREFAIDTVPGWRKAVEESLRDWRLTQVRSAVRDAPDAAAEVLTTLGYSVWPPAALPSPRSPEQVKLFRP